MADPSRHKRRKVHVEQTRPLLRPLASYNRKVSPPPIGNYPATDPATFDDENDPLRDFFRSAVASAPKEAVNLTVDRPDAKDVNRTGLRRGQPESSTATADSGTQTWPSPFRLTTIRDLPWSENKDTVGIAEILGDVMLHEVWLFNYMHNIHWVMAQFDIDIRAHVKVVFVHGNWKQEDEGRKRMEEEAKSYPNVKLVTAYMPEAFGTHHTKIMVLFRRDDMAQVIIHTANMIPFDWTNMTQAAWISPLLPPIEKDPTRSEIGDQFKRDLLEYFGFYSNSRCGPLVDSLKNHSFTSVKAIFIGSVPGRHKISEAKFGWPKLRKVLSTIPCPSIPGATPAVFAQCSSIATLGVKDTWLTPVFFSALSATATKGGKKPQFGIIFPTAQEIRESLNGYNSGSSIHLRLVSAAQQKQLEYLNPLFHHWSSQSQSAGRDRAAPHIKTYIRFSSDPKDTSTGIDWALVTSANLSMQAWGATEKDGMVRICSYEAGVLVHPGLWGEGVKMKPVFRKNEAGEEKVVGLRMPYGLPIAKYTKEDEVWTAGKSYKEVDWLGQSWMA
ncbi:tyrosyl-DNA phosphodiesterase-domain-containing protein [Trichophaea hybrida]|nr:tyrosyl-DNA phosphodiesterase-domain-containing protein [Trichophaea hybrida]